ncbi:MAG: hypothetical protein MKZ95_07745, partial [Pirellulales bacterium]|nr:hypothetical protein [Pirellulales bacterium]
VGSPGQGRHLVSLYPQLARLGLQLPSAAQGQGVGAWPPVIPQADVLSNKHSETVKLSIISELGRIPHFDMSLSFLTLQLIRITRRPIPKGLIS